MNDLFDFNPPTAPPTEPPPAPPVEPLPEPPPARRGAVRRPLLMLLGALVLVTATAVGGYAATRPGKSPLLTAPLGSLERFVDDQTADTLSLEIYRGDVDEMDYSELTDAIADIKIGESDFEAVLDHLGFSPGVNNRIENTRALDGTQMAEGKKATAHWTYHPDAGLSIVFERKG